MTAQDTTLAGDERGSSRPVPTGTLEQRLADVLTRDGLVAALGVLNARTRFRFTGLYEVDPPLLRNLCLYDRENPRLHVSGATNRLDATYCDIACTTGAFETGDSSQDARLEGHAARDSVLSYSGVSVRLPNGRLWGTLCHYDVRPRLLDAAEIVALQGVAPLFARWAQERERERQRAP